MSGSVCSGYTTSATIVGTWGWAGGVDSVGLTGGLGGWG